MEEIVRGLSGQYGVLFLVVGIAIAGFMGHWVFGWVYKAALLEKDKQLLETSERATRWEGIALKALQLGERVAGKVDNEPRV